MTARVHKTGNSIRIEYNLNSNQIIDLVLLWSDDRENKGFSFAELNAAYMKNIAKAMLTKHGVSILSKEVPEHLMLKRQDLLVAVKGYIEV